MTSETTVKSGCEPTNRCRRSRARVSSSRCRMLRPGIARRCAGGSELEQQSVVARGLCVIVQAFRIRTAEWRPAMRSCGLGVACSLRSNSNRGCGGRCHLRQCSVGSNSVRIRTANSVLQCGRVVGARQCSVGSNSNCRMRWRAGLAAACRLFEFELNFHSRAHVLVERFQVLAACARNIVRCEVRCRSAIAPFSNYPNQIDLTAVRA